MDKSSSYIQKVLFIFSILIAFVSCAQTSPSVNYSTGSVIFDYENENDLPSSRMAIFIDLDSDEHRAESIRVEALSSGLIWECFAPLKFENSDRKYTGYTNFVMPNSELFPQGQYKIIYTDAGDEKSETTLNVYYSTEIAEMTENDVVSYMQSQRSTLYWAAYDKDGILLFFGQKDGDYYDINSVWHDYQEAVAIRLVYMTAGSRTICIMPKTYKNIE